MLDEAELIKWLAIEQVGEKFTKNKVECEVKCEQCLNLGVVDISIPAHYFATFHHSIHCH